MKRATSLLLAFALIFCMMPTAFAANNKATEAADALNSLGLFKGTGTDATGKPIYDLDRAATRSEAVAMLVRLLGKENEATAGTWETPFTDVQEWAKPYVGYAYANKLTSGTSATTFGGDDTVTSTQYITLVLRALGYKDSEGDFQWDKAWELSDKIGITTGQYNIDSNTFLRADVAIISNDALSSNIKGTDSTLLKTIIPDTSLPEEKEDEASKLPIRDDDETFFGDKALKEYLLSLDPSNCNLNLRGEVDQYYYQDRFIADELYDGILKYIECIEVEVDSGKSLMSFLGVRVSCTDDDYYGRNVCVQTFSETGMYYSKIFYIRLPNR